SPLRPMKPLAGLNPGLVVLLSSARRYRHDVGEDVLVLRWCRTELSRRRGVASVGPQRMRLPAHDSQAGVVAVESDEARRRSLRADLTRGIRRLDPASARQRIVRVLLTRTRAGR